MIGLFLAVIQWETQFNNRGVDGRDISSVGFFDDFVVLVVSVMGVFAILLKYYFESIWQNYKNPVAFYKNMVQRQVEAGMIDEEDLTDNFKISRPGVWMVKQANMWLELLLMMIIPIPVSSGFFAQRVVTIEAINWVDNSGEYDSQSHKYDTPYFMTDFILAIMFLRFYFFALAMIMFSPANERLYGKRICQEAGFRPDFYFQIKAGMKASPIGTFFIMASVLIISLSYVVRIFERPYFTFNWGD